MPDEKRITVIEVKPTGTTESVEAPKAKVKATSLGLTPEKIEELIREKQKR
jgi:hypothetical protein